MIDEGRYCSKMATDDQNGTGRNPHQPSGTQRFVTRFLETVFSHWMLLLVPVLLCGAYGAYSAASEPDEYKSIGTLSVSYESFLGQLSQARASDFSYETPAARTARQFNELMGTSEFAQSVVDFASVDIPAIASLPIATARMMVYASPSGDSLMRVTGTANEPHLANVMVRSAVEAFSEWVIDTEVSASEAAESFYDDQLVGYEADVSRADDALNAYLKLHPEPVESGVRRDVAVELEIQRRNEALTRAQTRYFGAVDKRDAAKLATTQSSVDIKQRLRVVDSPSLPVAPESGLRSQIVTLMIFVVLGVLLALGAAALMTVLDRSIHSASELEWLGAPAQAVVPRVVRFGVRPPKSRQRPVAASPPVTEPALRSAG